MYHFVKVRPPKWLGWICHQLPERSFFIHGRQCWLCARCQGFYYFLLVGCILPVIFKQILLIPESVMIWLVVLSIFPLGIDGGTQYLGLRERKNWLRFLTGAICGFLIGLGLLYIILQSFFS